VALSDHALYAALAAEATRLRLHELLHFFIAFVCFVAFTFVMVDHDQRPQTGTYAAVKLVVLIVFLVSMGFFQYMRGLENSRRAQRLDIALSAAHKSRGLPVMD